jgi:hypothetical protein
VNWRCKASARRRLPAAGWRIVAAWGHVENLWYVNQVCMTMRRTCASAFSAAAVGLLRSGRSRASKGGRAARRSMTGVAVATTAAARGEMRHVRVGFCWKYQCARGALMPFAVGTLVAYNVFRFPTRREPTVRAAKACPPPSPIIHFHSPRWPAARRAAPRETVVI